MLGIGRWLVVDGLAADLMISLEERFGDETSHVSAASGVEDTTTFSPGYDQFREPQLRKVLACRSRRDPRERCQRCDIQLVVGDRPQDAQPTRLSGHGQGANSDLDLTVRGHLPPRIGFGGSIGRRLPSLACWHGSHISRYILDCADEHRNDI